MRTASTSVNNSTGAALVSKDDVPCNVVIANEGADDTVFYVSTAGADQNGLPVHGGQQIKLSTSVPLRAVADSGGGTLTARVTFLAPTETAF